MYLFSPWIFLRSPTYTCSGDSWGKPWGRHRHWTHDEKVKGGGQRETGATGPTVTKQGFSPPWGCNQAYGGTGAYLFQGDDEEGATSRALSDDGQEAGIDGAKMVIMHILGDGDPVEAVLPVGHLPVDVPELGAAVLRTPGHL